MSMLEILQSRAAGFVYWYYLSNTAMGLFVVLFSNRVDLSDPDLKLIRGRWGIMLFFMVHFSIFLVAVGFVKLIRKKIRGGVDKG